jgi:protein-tyrosine kinase
VSRIDEALQRVRGPARLDRPAGDAAPVFSSAWSVRDDADASSETTQPRSAPGEARPTSVLGDARPLAVNTGGVLRFSSEWNERFAGPTSQALVEQFRRLAASLHHAKRSHELRRIMVTSAAPGDGKTTTAINLALVLAESYRYNVLLIDADLRRPSIPRVVNLVEGSGLSDALRSPREQKLALVALTPSLTLLPAGRPTSNSIEALTSPRMRHILDEADTRFDWVVIDAPPVEASTDARLLAEMVDGTLFVIRAARTQHAAAQKAIDTLGRDRVLGVILNGAIAPSEKDYYYYSAEPSVKGKP